MFKTLLQRFVPPYKKSVVGVLFFSILSTVLSLFSFALIVPILEILFGISNPVEQAPVFEGFGNAFDYLKNYLYYYVTIFMNEYGKIQTLGFLAFGLIVMTFLKVITYYLSSVFMAYMQTGVVKDLRNNILDIAAMFLACGIDLEKTALFMQSDVLEHCNLGYLL